MDIEEYESRYRKVLSSLSKEAKITDEEITKMYISHLVVAKWEEEEHKKIIAELKKTKGVKTDG